MSQIAESTRQYRDNASLNEVEESMVKVSLGDETLSLLFLKLDSP